MPRKENTFLLVSLEESKAKKLAQVINNDACRKILDYLANKEATETELSKELNLPISTVHYNLKHLLESGLVKSEEFHYSAKGKEVNHYALANKYIIIAPKVTESLSHKLKKILPVATSIAAISLVMEVVNLFKGVTFAAAPLRAKAEGVTESVAEAALAAPEAQPSVIPPAEPSIALWFFIGAMSALIIYFIYDLLKERWKR